MSEEKNNNSVPFASFEINYTKKDLIYALGARKHIIYTLSPLITIIALFLYIIAMYFYFSDMKDIIGNIVIGKIFSVMWVTVMSLIVGSVVVFFTAFEIIRLKNAKAILKQMPHITTINVFENELKYNDGQATVNIKYSDFYSIYETEEFYFITLKNKQIIVLDKSKAKGYHGYLKDIARMYHIYGQSSISNNGLLEITAPKKLAKIKNMSIRLIPLCIASIHIFILPFSATLLPVISSTAGTVRLMLKIIVCIAALMSNVFPVYSIIFGAKYKKRNMKTTKNIVIGCITLFYSALFSLAICFAVPTM